MTRRRFIQVNGELVEVGLDHLPEPRSAMVFGDTPGYMSQTGRWIEGRVQRKDDLRRSSSRPWEGLDQEKKESARQQSYADAKMDESLTRTASEAFYQLPPAKQAILRRGK